MPLLEPEQIPSETCARAFDKLFWSFLFLFDLNIGVNEVKVDVLPDLIGWILMHSALGSIASLHSDIPTIRLNVRMLLILSVLDLVSFPIHFDEYNVIIVPVSIAIGLVQLVLTIMVVWKVCGLVIDIATFSRDTALADQADFRRKFYIGGAIFVAAAIGAAFLEKSLILPALFIGFPWMMIAIGLLMGLMAKTARLCRRGASI